MVSHPHDPSRPQGSGQASRTSRGDRTAAPAERVARALARAGVSSRREAERLIEAGRVALNGEVLTSPAINVGPEDILTLDGEVVADREPPRLWRYHKPAGLLTTHNDPKGRPTVFEHLPPGLPRVISIGRLDFNSEGLLLLTNDGALAREMELPSGGFKRRYRARAFGRTTQGKLDQLKDGIVVDGVAYGAIEAELEGEGTGSNVWISLTLSEGKNREVRKVLDALGLKVNRLIRVAYGPFELEDLLPGEAAEAPARQVRALQSGAGPHEPPLRAEPARGPRPGARSERGAAPGARTARLKPAPKGRPAAAKAAGGEAPAKVAYKAGWARPKSKPKPKPKPARSRRKDAAPAAKRPD